VTEDAPSTSIGCVYIGLQAEPDAILRSIYKALEEHNATTNDA